ncbi:hypothetical protein BC834DRAFT_966294 [Gloeopeniophorella convolvens]|nr:hypothetical protein BC834DRAFT_966294 [Gloeopeniophorella convolvens]
MSVFIRKILPFVLFASLSYGGNHFLLGHLIKSGGAAAIEGQCPPNSGTYNVRYTGVGVVDTILCIPVTFFQANYDPDTLPFSTDFGASWTSLIALSFVEAARQGRSIFLAFPAVIGLLCQLQGAGVIFPLFWILLILSGHARLSKSAARIDQANAEAQLFALFIGFLVPSATLIAMQDPGVTALWQFFPLLMSVARSGHLFFRPSLRYATSGYRTVQATFVFTFLLSAISHTAVFWPARHDVAQLKYLYVPPIAAPDPAKTSLHLATHIFLKWDAIFTLGSGLIGTLWFAQDAQQAVAIALWNVIATALAGPGAAISGVLLWRESKLNGASEDVSKKTR